MRETEWDGSREWNHETDGCFYQGGLFCIYCGMTAEDVCDDNECDGCCKTDDTPCHRGGCDMCVPDHYGISDEDVYWSGTGELMSDDSYIDYLNR
jgi:hypothetical protein